MLYDESIEQYNKCLAINPKKVPALNKLANLYFLKNDKLNTIQICKKSLAIEENEIIFNLLGLAYLESKQVHLAINCFSKALNIKPNNFEFLCNIASAYAVSGNETCLKTSLQKLLSFNTLNAYVFTVTIYEESNHIKLAKKTCNRGLKLFPNNGELIFLKSKIYKQRRKYNKSLKLINFVLKSNHEQLTTDAFFLKSQVLDKLKIYDKAWKFAKKANRLSLKNWNKTNPKKDKYNEICKEMASGLKKIKNRKYKENDSEAGSNLVFIFGFTRSGTTLIDSLLSAHTDITILEELPLIRNIFNKLESSNPKNIFNELNSLSNQQKSKLREDYYSSIKKYIDWNKNGILVDKSPLNTTLVAFVHIIFPKAKIIFSVRHPLDITVSCFFQQFKFNSYMTNMVKPKSIAKTYNAMLNLWEKSIVKYQIDIHYQHYEELICDFENQAKNLIGYIGLNWQPSILSYQNSLSARGAILNPSYNQVNQAIYQTAQNRYKNYLSYLDDAIKILQPWIDYFGYKIEK